MGTPLIPSHYGRALSPKKALQTSTSGVIGVSGGERLTLDIFLKLHIAV
jgi:hypothetical protein